MNQRAEKVACGHSVVTYSCPDVNNERKDGFSAQPRNLSLVSHVEMRNTNHLDLPQDWSKNNSRETLATSKQKTQRSFTGKAVFIHSKCCPSPSLYTITNSLFQEVALKTQNDG